MLLLVFFIAAFNLAVGYALGAGLDLGWVLDRLPKRPEKAPSGDIEDDEQLTRPPPKPKAEPLERPTAPETAEPPTKPANPKPSPAEVMASLQSFRSNLTDASTDLKENADDELRFGESATKLQKVNHAYLEEAEGAIQHLDELGAEGDKIASATSKAVAKGAEEVAELSGKLDSLIENGLGDQAARDQVVETSEHLVEAGESAEQATEDAISTPDVETTAEDAGESPPKRTLDSIDELFKQLDQSFADAEAEATQHVAAIRVDPIADHEDDAALVESIEERIAAVTLEMLGESQPFIAGQPSIALLNGDSFDDAADRVERIRQQVEATTFQSKAGEVQATVTCAVVDTHADDARDKVIELLNLALDEGVRQGSNQSYHHDGAFPTPLDTRSVETQPRVVEV